MGDLNLSDKDIARMAAAIAASYQWQRTLDIAPPKMVRDIPKDAWYGPITIVRPSLLQLMNAGVDVDHRIYGQNGQAGATAISEGLGIPNDIGRVYMLQVGDWYIYVPSESGDPTTFTARITDSSSDLPSQQNANDETGGSIKGKVVRFLNRGTWFTTQKNVTTAGTPVNLSSQAIPGGFALTVKAKVGNTGNIGIGNSSPNALLAGTACFVLAPGESVRLFVKNANMVWVDSAVNGEGVYVGAET